MLKAVAAAAERWRRTPSASPSPPSSEPVHRQVNVEVHYQVGEDGQVKVFCFSQDLSEIGLKLSHRRKQHFQMHYNSYGNSCCCRIVVVMILRLMM